jgi:HAD superfamily (subfamily IIIA) phosphatase
MSPEEAVYTYMSKVTDKILQDVIIPDFKYKDVKQIDFAELKRLTEKYGIEGIILDIDGTLREDMKKIDYRNIKWMFELSKILKICMVSNGIDKRVKKLADKLEIKYIPLAFKPLKRGFKQALQEMQIDDPGKVLVVGDEYLADIVGGKKMTMKTALIEDKDEER